MRTLELLDWAVVMLRRRREESEPNEQGVAFPAPGGNLRDPSNTQADLRVAFTAAGFEWVTSHVYRKTVATQMDGAGLTARQAADHLSHAKVSMTHDSYFDREAARTGAAGLVGPRGIEPRTRGLKVPSSLLRSSTTLALSAPRDAGAAS